MSPPETRGRRALSVPAVEVNALRGADRHSAGVGLITR